MSDLLTALTVTAVAPFLFGQPSTASSTNDLLQIKQSTVAQVKIEAPKKEVKKQEAPKAPETPKVVTYVVQENDNLSTVAEKYQTTWVRIWQKNTQLQNQDQLSVGETLTIPNTDEVLADRPPVSPPAAPVSAPSGEVAQVTTSAPSVSYRGSGGPNGYDYGWCTWWVKEKRPDIGGYWGDAGYNWISAAQSAGFSTGSTPVAGAIGVQAGHVVYVESVSGSQVNISEMGWGYRANTVPNYRTVSASQFTYIY
jgi:surface antigen